MLFSVSEFVLKHSKQFNLGISHNQFRNLGYFASTFLIGGYMIRAGTTPAYV